MDLRAIGVLDTGVGGLTAVRCLRALLPGEDIVFFSDTARVPYGGRSAQEITAFGLECVSRLASRGIKALLVACGTITSTCLDEAAALAGVPTCGVIAPAAAEAVAASKTGRIGVFSTVATARTGAFAREIHAVNPAAEVFSHGALTLVPLVEAGRVDAEDEEVSGAVDVALRPFDGSGIDTLILGCTHFPLLSGVISRRMRGVALIDSGTAGARRCAELLGEHSLLSERPAGGRLKCLVTGDTARFARNAALFLPGADFTIERA